MPAIKDRTITVPVTDAKGLKRETRHGKSTFRQKFNLQAIGDSKLYEYIRAIYVEGSTRAAAYVKYIDSDAYSLTPKTLQNRMDAIPKLERYEELKSIVLTEERDYILRRSATLQNKAMELLVSTMEAAQKRIEGEDASSKDIQAAATVIKSLMPAYQAINQPAEDPNAATPGQRRSRVKAIING